MQINFARARITNYSFVKPFRVEVVDTTIH